MATLKKGDKVTVRLAAGGYARTRVYRTHSTWFLAHGNHERQLGEENVTWSRGWGKRAVEPMKVHAAADAAAHARAAIEAKAAAKRADDLEAELRKKLRIAVGIVEGTLPGGQFGFSPDFRSAALTYVLQQLDEAE